VSRYVNIPPTGSSTWTVVTAGSDVADLTIATGLDGAADGGYEIVCNHAALAGTETFTLRPNNVDTGCVTFSCALNGATTPDDITSTTLFLTDGVVGQTPMWRVILQSNPATMRLFKCDGTRGPQASGAGYLTTGSLTAAAGNITSLVLHASSADGIKTGTIVRWRKIPGYS
jgi:hypothetical protein